MAEPLTTEDLARMRARLNYCRLSLRPTGQGDYFQHTATPILIEDVPRLLVEVDRQNARIAALTEQRAAKLAGAEAAFRDWFNAKFQQDDSYGRLVSSLKEGWLAGVYHALAREEEQR